MTTAFARTAAPWLRAAAWTLALSLPGLALAQGSGFGSAPVGPGSATPPPPTFGAPPAATSPATPAPAGPITAKPPPVFVAPNTPSVTAPAGAVPPPALPRAADPSRPFQPAFDALKKGDYAAAEAFLKPYADKREPRAQFLLGWEVYANPASSLASPAKAVPLIRDSAERGFPRAQASLGAIYADGALGLSKDLVQGYTWMALASRHKLPDADPALARMAQEMTPEQIERAKAAATNFKPKR